MTEREELRSAYWNRKYDTPDWAEDIHFALFGRSDASLEGFRKGIVLNTQELLHDMLEMASVYRLAGQPFVLDFGCGAGDFLIAMALAIPDMSGVGVDIASGAIERAHTRLAGQRAELTKRLRFELGGLQELESRTDALLFDIIICRDMYYLLDSEEQTRFLIACRARLNEGGLLCIADLAVRFDHVEIVKQLLIERQYGGQAITWKSNGKNVRSYSIATQAAGTGFEEIWPAKEYETAVFKSYAAAAFLAADPTVRTAFEALSNAARPEEGRALARIPYVRFFFAKLPEGPPAHDGLERLGIHLDDGFAYRQRTIINQGVWAVPKGKWSLIVGRSGSGKSTFLHLLAGWIGSRRAKREGIFPASIFLLGQRPTLITQISVEENVYLFASDRVDVEAILNGLGFDEQVRRRKANDELSGGERQRVALGQAIAANPGLLLLDEPCTGVDKVRKYQFFRLIHETRKQSDEMTVVCVDHDFGSIDVFFDCIFEIINGRLVLLANRT